MMNQCFFCTGETNSIEDAWPLWITNQFRATRPSEVQAERHGVPLTPWRILQPEMKVRCVCRTCNNEWMSKLECQTQPFLQPLLKGERYGVNEAGQGIIANWCLKTAMVMEALDPKEFQMYTQTERERLRSVSAIPWRTSIWISASTDPSIFMSTKIRLGISETEPASGVSITMAFSHVAMQILTIRVPEHVGPDIGVKVDVRRGPWAQTTVQIWPPRLPLVVWPPLMALNGVSGIDDFSDRFRPAAEEVVSTETLVV